MARKTDPTADYDTPWKEALELFEPFMAFFFPVAHADIDWSSRFEPLDKELQQILRAGKHGRRTVDKLVKVWRKNGQEEWVLVHVEVQGDWQAEFSKRMHICNGRIFDRYDRKVATMVVLTDDHPKWRPGEFGYDLWGCRVQFEFPAVKLSDYAKDWAALEASTNPFAVVVMAQLKSKQTSRDPAGRQAWKLRLVRMLYEKGWTRQTIINLFRMIDWMMALPVDLEASFREEVVRIEQEARMPYVTSVERLAKREGKREGIVQLIAIGLRERFGRAALDLLPELEAVRDMRVLLAVQRALMRSVTLDDVKKLLA